MKRSSPAIFLLTNLWDSRSSFVVRDRAMLEKRYRVFQLSYVQKSWRSPLRVFKYVAKSDICYAWFSGIHAFWALLACRILGKKMVVVAGGYDAVYLPDIGYGIRAENKGWRRAYFTFRYADAVLAVSNFIVNSLRNECGASHNVHLVHNGVDPAVFRPHGVKERLILTVAGVFERNITIKGLCHFLEVARMLPDERFVLVGGGDNECLERLKSKAPQNVTFAGELSNDETRRYMQRAQVYVQLSAQESFCVALAEAMLCECIPVVTNRGALPEIAGPGALYVEYGDITAIEAQIKSALSIKSGQRYRLRIAELFTLAARERKITERIEALLGRGDVQAEAVPVIGADTSARHGESAEVICCTRCVLDQTARKIIFDHDGVCNYCHGYNQLVAARIAADPNGRELQLQRTIAQIRHDGRRNRYDCVMGLSGGVDSSYLAYLVKQWGLRPLAVHFDNGWDSELAVKNIQNLIGRLEFDLFTYVIDWEEFRDLQLAYFRSSVVDIEVPTDHFIIATLHKVAHKNGIRHILSGNNIVTEAIMPAGWNYNKRDAVNIRNIHRKFGARKLAKYPFFTFYKRHYYRTMAGIQSHDLLDFVDYTKEKAKEVIGRELQWRDYGIKHGESVFTRFYQGYILPRKFGIDKRKAHLSNLVCSKQITREQALQELAHTQYSEKQQAADKEYALKKWRMAESEFDAIMRQPEVPHEAYGTEADEKLWYYLYAGALSVAMRGRRACRALMPWKPHGAGCL